MSPTAAGTLVTESFDYSRHGLGARLVIELAGFPARNRQGIAGTLIKLKEAAEADAREETRMSIREGSTVTWSWGQGTASGTVTEIHRDKVTRTTKGEQITRNGSDDDPAYVIEQDDGTTVLKLRSEVERS